MKKALPFLAVAFSGFFVYIFDKIWGNSIDWTKVKSIKISEFLTKEIEFYQIIIFVMTFNNYIIEEPNILMRWKVSFLNDTPFITNLTAFCQKHEGAPIRFIHNYCPVQDCENKRIVFNELVIKNEIESDLIDRWEKMK
jgi:hypothetical protein